MSAHGTKRTNFITAVMSAYDPKRKFEIQREEILPLNSDTHRLPIGRRSAFVFSAPWRLAGRLMVVYGSLSLGRCSLAANNIPGDVDLFEPESTDATLLLSTG